MKKLIAALMAGSMLVMAFAPAVSAAHWSSVESVSARVGQQCVGGDKINIPDDFVSGTVYQLGDWAVRIWITDTGAGEVLEFQTSSGHVVNSVIIKGGPVDLSALKYNYVPGTQHDSGLHARLNDNSGKWYGVSFVCFQSSKHDK
jgi:hypothetical protein